MFNIAKHAAVGALVLLSASCQKPGPTIAVVDLERLAKGLGRDVELQRALQGMEGQMRGELVALRDRLTRELVQAQEKAGKTPNAETARQLDALKASLQKQLDEEAAQAQQKVQAKRGEVSALFKEEARAAARKVSTAKGFTAVLAVGEHLLDFDPAADVTNDVLIILRQQAAGPSGGEQGQMPQQGQMMPQQGQMMPPQGQMMPSQGQMMPQQGQMVPQQGPATGQQGVFQGGMQAAPQMPPGGGGYPPPTAQQVQNSMAAGQGGGGAAPVAQQGMPQGFVPAPPYVPGTPPAGQPAR